MSLIILILILGIEVIVSNIIEFGDILSPDFIFSFIFFLAAVDLQTMNKTWDTSLHSNTILIITLSVFLFMIAVEITKLFYSRYGNYKKERIRNKTKMSIVDIINKRTVWFKLFTIYNIIASVIYLYFLVRAVRGAGFSGTIPFMIFRYGEIQKGLIEVTALSIPSLPSTLYHICMVNSYLWGFLTISYLCETKRINKWLIICFITSFISTLLEGSRGYALLLLVGMLILYFVLQNQNKGKRRLNYSQIIRLVLSVIVIAGLFNLYISIAGVDTGVNNTWEYISIYLGAPIKNLDTYLQGSIKQSNIFGLHTLGSTYSWLSERFGFNFQTNNLLLFKSSNGHGLGNVYTIFQNLITDFNIIGTFIFIFLMGCLVETLYIKAEHKTKYISLNKISYMYIIPTIALSFFSNKFAENVLNINFLYALLSWYLTSQLLKLKVRIR